MNRSDRFSTLLPLTPFLESHILIIGCGSIGAVIARTLASMGLTRFTLLDPDVVSEENLGTQGWSPDSLGKPKVEALHDNCYYLNPSTRDHILTHQSKAPPIPDCTDLPYTFAFLCVDSIPARASIYAALPTTLPFVDSRMGAEVCRTIFVPPSLPDPTVYTSTLPAPRDVPRIPCTERSTLYCAQLAAAFAISRFTRYLRNPLLPFSDHTCDLPSLSLFPTD